MKKNTASLITICTAAALPFAAGAVHAANEPINYTSSVTSTFVMNNGNVVENSITVNGQELNIGTHENIQPAQTSQIPVLKDIGAASRDEAVKSGEDEAEKQIDEAIEKADEKSLMKMLKKIVDALVLRRAENDTAADAKDSVSAAQDAQEGKAAEDAYAEKTSDSDNAAKDTDNAPERAKDI